ncbi:hypothetical protein CFP56_005725 [Quercus suber]|uniref:Uncharacterized protein n=1 Tax=Quercus suber TaxID=58331 RepID=A0AAW0L8V8_QUESU
MAGNESFEALRVENSKSHEVVVVEEEEEEEEEEYEEDPEEEEVEESEEEEDEEDEREEEPLSELQSSAPLGEPKLGDSHFETLAPSSSSLQSSLNDHCAVLAVNSTSQSLGRAEVQVKVLVTFRIWGPESGYEL